MKCSNFHLGVGIPLSHQMIPSAFFDSFVGMVKPPFTYFRTSNGPIHEMRNNIARSAVESGCTHLIMMDTDQMYHPDTIPRLLSHRLPIAGCLVYRRYPPFDPLMMRGVLGSYHTVTEWEPNSLVEVDATGTGCIMFNMSVFRGMPYPWFKTGKFQGQPIGEDVGFCSELRAAGYKIFVDTSIPAGHLSQIQITESFWRLHSKIVEAGNVQNAVEHNVVKTTGLEGG